MPVVPARLIEEDEVVASISLSEVDYIAELTIKAMPDGIRGFTRTWGWRDFARTLVQNLKPYSLRLTRDAALTVEDVLAEFDRRALPNTGYYDPDEPSKIIREMIESAKGATNE